MKKTLVRICVIVLLLAAGSVAQTTPAHASQGYVMALIGYNPTTKTLTYGGNALGWGSTQFEFEGWLYNGLVMVEHVTRATCTGSCNLRTGNKICPAGGIWKMDVWAFPKDGTQSRNDNKKVTVI